MECYEAFSYKHFHEQEDLFISHVDKILPWSLELFIRLPFQLHGEQTVLQPFRRIELIVHIVISVLPGTYFHLSQVKHLREKCLAQGHNSLTMSQD